MKTVIFDIISMYICLIMIMFLCGIITSKRECNEKPARIVKYTGLYHALQLGCYLGEKVE